MQPTARLAFVYMNLFDGLAALVRGAFRPDSKKIASGGADGTIKVWDATMSQP